MANQSTVLRGRNKGAQIGDLEFDCTPVERHSSSASVTDHTIEEGGNVANHVTQDPDSLSLDGLWTDTPNGADRASLGRAADLYEQLRALKEAGEPLDVITGLRVYEGMIITNIDTIKDANTGYSVPTSVALRPVRIAKAETTVVPVDEIDESLRHSATPENERGRESTTDPDEDTAERGSIIYQIWKGG